ncbi:MAG: 16S rRNA processing protein RimM [Muribaculaceae bacterium]|nr:16S rRNA processing protein RimM [Muribaculaceae bacterium]
MLKPTDTVSIGHTLKPHGIKGELVAVLDCNPLDLTCIFLEMEGLMTPFFLSSARARSSESWLLTVDNVDNEAKAKTLCGHTVFALKSEVETEDEEDADGMYASDFVGYAMKDAAFGDIGVIDDIDDSTENVLFLVRNAEGNIVYVPVADEFIVDIDTDNKILEVDLPEGLIE